MTTQLKPMLTAATFLILMGGVAVAATEAGRQKAIELINTAEQQDPNLYEVVQFADGDTITVLINGEREKVRFLGIDTPEKNHDSKPVQCFAQAASDFTQNTIGTQKVRLEADPTNTNRDRFDRLLRYVYLPDGTLVNQAIIAEGYGFVFTAFPFEKSDDFKASEAAARRDERGLWGGCEVTNDDGYFQTGPADP